MAYTSKVVKVNKLGYLRSGIPSALIKLLELEAGDTLEWKVIPQDNKFIIQVEKKEWLIYFFWNTTYKTSIAPATPPQPPVHNSGLLDNFK